MAIDKTEIYLSIFHYVLTPEGDISDLHFEVVDWVFLSLFLSLLVSLKLEHYTRECEFRNFDKIKKQKQHKSL